MEGSAPAVARCTSHVLVPCRADAVRFVRQFLARDLASWQVDEAITDGLLLAAAEAVLDTVAARGASAASGGMLVISWTLGDDRPDHRQSFRFSVVERGLPGAASRAVAMRAHPAAMRDHPALSQRRCVMDALMDRVVFGDISTGARIVLEKTFPATA